VQPIYACTMPCCRFDQLRDLIPHKDKLDKAAFLQKTIDYICQLQVLDVPRGGLHACVSRCSHQSRRKARLEACGAWLQGVLQQLLDMGVVSTLTEDLQWNIRMLLPRQVCAWRHHPRHARPLA
jgi:Helix-loop-helix DNA-binding domain